MNFEQRVNFITRNYMRRNHTSARELSVTVGMSPSWLSNCLCMGFEHCAVIVLHERIPELRQHLPRAKRIAAYRDTEGKRNRKRNISRRATDKKAGVGIFYPDTSAPELWKPPHILPPVVFA